MNKTSYFSHDSNARNDEKILAIRIKLGVEGYGIYFMILERLREESDYMSIKDYNLLAFDFRVSADKVKSVIEDFGLFVFTEDRKHFYSESFNQRMTPLENMREQRSKAGQKSAEKRAGNNDRSTTVEQSSNDRSQKNQQSKVKESKEEESKEEEEEKKTPPPPTLGSENFIMSFEDIKERICGEIFTDDVCCSRQFNKNDFIKFRDDWLELKRLSGDYLYQINKLKSWLISDYQKQENGNGRKTGENFAGWRDLQTHRSTPIDYEREIGFRSDN